MRAVFFDVDVFTAFVAACRAAGIAVPILPGIMVIQAYGGFRRMTTFCKSRVPKEVWAQLDAVKDDADAVKAAGVKIGADMCRKLLAAYVAKNHRNLRAAGMLAPVALTHVCCCAALAAAACRDCTSTASTWRRTRSASCASSGSQRRWRRRRRAPAARPRQRRKQCNPEYRSDKRFNRLLLQFRSVVAFRAFARPLRCRTGTVASIASRQGAPCVDACVMTSVRMCTPSPSRWASERAAAHTRQHSRHATPAAARTRCSGSAPP